MSGKRFIIIGDDNIEFIMQAQLLLPIYDNKERLSLKTCCDLLNELYEENQQIKELKEDNKQYKLIVESLKDENQKLKLQLKDLGVEYY